MITCAQGAGPFWLDSVVGDKNSATKLPFFEYKPDVDRIISRYYTGIVIKKLFEFEGREENYSKLALSRYTSTTDVSSELREICYLYLLDVTFKMVNMQIEQYYKNFSWERITGESEIDYYKKLSDIRNDENIDLRKKLSI